MQGHLHGLLSVFPFILGYISVRSVVILAELFNAGGFTLFTLVSEAWGLDVATILSSLSPAVTVLLACILLKEQLALRQWVGVIAALNAMILYIYLIYFKCSFPHSKFHHYLFISLQ
ncbi:EamA family transporter [Methanolobus psychrotolerans]|uniref:EamA family transporter n=1 Tax=Methanolobus psychrotolerans TaxID=1874706 RepID=UPI000B91D003|nr:EamA family transporter [Methanolobus psychrotolerans]